MFKVNNKDTRTKPTKQVNAGWEADCNILFILIQFKLGFLKILEDQVLLTNSLFIWFTTAMLS